MTTLYCPECDDPVIESADNLVHEDDDWDCICGASGTVNIDDSDCICEGNCTCGGAVAYLVVSEGGES